MPTHPDAAGIAFAWRPTQDDLEAFFSDRLRNGHAYAFSRRQIRAARSLLLVGLLAGATGAILLVADNALGGMFLFFGVAATLLTLRPALLPTRTLHRRALPHFRTLDHTLQLQPHDLRLDDAGLHLTTPLRSATDAWPAFREVRLDTGRLFLVRLDDQGYAVPEAVLRDAGHDPRDVLMFATQRIARARIRPPHPAAPTRGAA